MRTPKAAFICSTLLLVATASEAETVTPDKTFQVQNFDFTSPSSRAFVTGFFQGSWSGITRKDMSGGVLLAYLQAGVANGTIQPTMDIRTVLFGLMLQHGCTLDHPPVPTAAKKESF